MPNPFTLAVCGAVCVIALLLMYLSAVNASARR